MMRHYIATGVASYNYTTYYFTSCFSATRRLQEYIGVILTTCTYRIVMCYCHLQGYFKENALHKVLLYSYKLPDHYLALHVKQHMYMSVYKCSLIK